MEKSTAKKFIVVTEFDMNYRLNALYPDKERISDWLKAICLSMKQITLQSIWESLKFKRNKVKDYLDITKKTRRAIKRMLEL